MLALRPVHHAVDDEGVLLLEEVFKRRFAVFSDKAIIFPDFSSRRQSASHLTDPPNLASQPDFFDEKGSARFAIFVAFVRKPFLASARQRGGGDETFVFCHTY